MPSPERAPLTGPGRRDTVKYFRDRPYAWVLYLTAACLYSTAVLRTPLAFPDGPVRNQALVLLLASLVLFAGVEALDRRWQWLFPIYVGLQSVVVVFLVSKAESADFYAVLFAVVSSQVMQRYGGRVGTAVICLFVPLTALPLSETHSLDQTIVLTLTYTAVSILLASYALAARRVTHARQRTQALVRELREANDQMAAYSGRLERLAVARERQRLMRDLHDSVTQTIFSMTLTTQSALLLLDRDPARVGAQLERLAQLTQTAQSEMKALVSELRPDQEDAGLVAALRRHLAGHAVPRDLSVSLEIRGDQRLSSPEEQALFRIAQEALNNVVKHAGASQAAIRLRLEEPFSMEIADQGRGFQPGRDSNPQGLGLAGMHERAAGIGWNLRILASPGTGTRVIAERDTEQGESG
jgi:signal transduction histidine kinase